MHDKYIFRHFFYQIQPDILTHLLLFGSSKGSPNTPKICHNIMQYLAEKCLIIYNYFYLFECLFDLTVVFLCMYDFSNNENLCNSVILKLSILYLPSIK